MAKEDEWLRAPKLGVWLMGATLAGFLLMILAASSLVPSYGALIGGALVLASVLAVAATAFALSRRHGLGIAKSFLLAGKTVFRWLFFFAP
jgi:hypothetical protein